MSQNFRGQLFLLFEMIKNKKLYFVTIKKEIVFSADRFSDKYIV